MTAIAESSSPSTSSAPAASAMPRGRITQHTPRPPHNAERGPSDAEPARRLDDPTTASAAAQDVPG